MVLVVWGPAPLAGAAAGVAGARRWTTRARAAAARRSRSVTGTQKNRSGTELGTPHLQAPPGQSSPRGVVAGGMAATRCAARGTRRQGITKPRGRVRLPEAWIPALTPRSMIHWIVLRIPRRHRLDGRTEGLDVAFAHAEGGSRLSQGLHHHHGGRVPATEHAQRDAFRVLERRHGLAEVLRAWRRSPRRAPPRKSNSS